MSLGEADGATDGASFPEELRRRREAMRLSQVAFAMKLHRVGDAEDIDADGIDGNTVSRWERGRQWPDPGHRVLICKALKATPRELRLDRKPSRATRPDSGCIKGLGFHPPSTQLTTHACNAADAPALRVPVNDYDELVARIEAGRTLSADMICAFFKQTELLRSLDRRLGAVVLTEQMRAHLGALEEALTFAVRPETRGLIARALAGAATLAAWQALDAGSLDRAWRLYEHAKRAASEASDTMLLAHAMGEQAYVISDAGQPSLAVELVREAKTTGDTRLSPRLAAWLSAAEAELCARAGLASDCQRALESALAHLPTGDEARDPDVPSVFLNATHLRRWSGNALALLGDDGAMDELYAALNTMDPTFIRATAGVHCDLAQAHLARGERSLAKEHLDTARALTRRIGSVRHRQRAELLSRRL